MLDLPQSITSALPTDTLSTSILQHAHGTLSRPTFNHSLRTYLLAQRLHNLETTQNLPFTNPSTTTTQPTFNSSILFAVCLLHDIGTSNTHNGPSRFEIEGADAAVQYVRSHGLQNEADLHAIWCAIALHTSVGIAERIDPFTRLVRCAVKSDFSIVVREGFGLTAYGREIEAVLPRLDIERCLAEEVVEQATRGEKEQGLRQGGDGEGMWTDSVKFPHASWPGSLLRGYLEEVGKHGQDWKGRNPAF